MPLKKVLLKPGVNRENTRYTNEGGWYESDKIRFRQGTPEKIGGWQRISSYTFLGVCRSLWNWVTLGGQNLIGVGTNLKFYIERGGAYYDVTPIRSTVTLTNPFSTTNTLPTVLVTDVDHGCITGDFVTFSGASAVGGLTLNGEFQVTVIDEDTYNITASSNATSTANGGGTVTAAYQLNTGNASEVPITGWGAGAWGSGTWGESGVTNDPIRLWSQSNFGEDLIFAYRGGPICYWYASSGTDVRGVLLEDVVGASDVPTVVNGVFVSDVSRFVFAFGCNELGDTELDPMLIRWSDQENPTMWTPSITNQAGGLRLSHGSEITTYLQSRQEILVWTDSSLYSLQYLGSPDVWGSQLLGDNLSIASPNAVAFAGGVSYWMGVDKFYKYDGTVATLVCDLRKFVFNDINNLQQDQFFASTNEGFNEVWWFYCTAGSTAIDRYVVYNYVENIWYYGSMARTAWLDSGLRNYPLAATYNYNLVNHEYGTDDAETATTEAIYSYILSAEFDLDDGHQFNFIWRVLPDVTFNGSSADAPAITMTLLPLKNSGSGYNNPLSVGGQPDATITRSAVIPVEQYTGQVFTRVRGRQMAMKVESDALGVAWQLGAPRLDMRPDGRR
jgi:hypothetical protein